MKKRVSVSIISNKTTRQGKVQISLLVTIGMNSHYILLSIFFRPLRYNQGKESSYVLAGLALLK